MIYHKGRIDREFEITFVFEITLRCIGKLPSCLEWKIARAQKQKQNNKNTT